LSEAITLVKPTICIVGRIATKKNSQPVKAARVQRREMSSSGIKMQVPITACQNHRWERIQRSGKGSVKIDLPAIKFYTDKKIMSWQSVKKNTPNAYLDGRDGNGGCEFGRYRL